MHVNTRTNHGRNEYWVHPESKAVNQFTRISIAIFKCDIDLRKGTVFEHALHAVK